VRYFWSTENKRKNLESVLVPFRSASASTLFSFHVEAIRERQLKSDKYGCSLERSCRHDGEDDLWLSKTNLVVVVVAVFAMLVTEGLLYIELSAKYDSLQSLYDELNDSYRELSSSYSDLEAQYVDMMLALEVYGNVTVTQARLIMERKPSLVVVDVRLYEAFESGHLRGAVSICTYCSMDYLLENLSPEDEILLYGQDDSWSLRALQFLNQHGYERVYNMIGGLDAWTAAGYPVTSG